MKKQMKLFTYMTKPLALFVLLFALGVGQMWAGTRRVYFDYSSVTTWTDNQAILGVHCWGGGIDAHDYVMSSVEGQSNLIYADIDDRYVSLCFYRANPEGGSWWNQTQDWGTIGSYNRFKIKNQKGDYGSDDGKYLWADTDQAIRWTPSPAIDGLIDINNPHNQAFDFDGNEGTYEVTLSAHTTYQFCILDGSTRYTVDNNVWSGTIPGYTLGTTGYDIRLATAGAGTYKFEYNKSTHVMKVTYPTVNHPNIDYCYLYKFNDWTHHYLHIYDSESSIEGTTYPGTEIENYFEIGDEKYYYFAPGDYANCQPNDNDDGRKVNPAASTSAGLGKFQKYITDSWGWRTFTVRVQLNDLTPTTHVAPTYLDVAFNSAELTDLTTVPTKTHYDFGGFYTGYDAVNEVAIGTQVIDEDGHWIASVDDYTDASKHWIHAGMSTTLYAKWTEHEYALTINISPAGAGTVSPSPTIVTYATPTELLTATPSHGAWIFKEWQYSTNLGPYSETGLDNTVQVTASQDGTLTAVFEPRYCLVGEIYNGGGATGGMPGWTTYTEDFTVNSTSPSVNLTCVRKLDPNTTFRFNVHDKKTNKNLGHSPAGQYISDNSWEFANQDNDVLLPATGHGNYTFTISAIRQDGDNYYPTVSVSGPSSHLVNLSWADVNIDGGWDKSSRSTGGTVAAVATESGDENPITNGQYVAAGGSITYTATPAKGYSFGGWWNSNWSKKSSDTNPYTSSSIAATENMEAKFDEKYTTVTITTNNSAGGSITVGGSAFSWGSTKTAGVTTKRTLVISENTGYNFTGWALSSTPDFELQDKDGDTDKEVTLAGKGGTNGSSGTLTANFTAKTYSVTLNNDHGGESSDDGTATATYDATTLAVSSHATFSGWTLVGYWNMDGNQVTDASGNLKKDVTNYTDGDGKWKYDSNVSLWAHWSRSITLDDNGESADGSVTVTYKGTAGTPSAPTKTGYHVEGYYVESGCTNKVMDADGTLHNYSGYVTGGKWTRGEATTLYAKWEPDTYTVTLHNDHEGASSDDGTATATYDATTLAVSSHATFSGWTLVGYWNSSALQVADENGNLKANVTGFTDGSGKWTKTDNAELWAHWTRTITLDDNVSQLHNGSVSVTYKGAAASHSAPHARAGYTVNGYYNDAACTTKVMNNDGTLVSSVSGYTDGSGNWTHKTAATLYAKWTSDHFIIYRTGDKSDDPRKLATDVESYAGGTISEAIEFRMKVRELDTWYTLCLPFTVSAVKVWEEEECAYYDLVPFYRPEVGSKDYYTGDYIIRTPKQTGNLAIAEFGDWRDPTSPTGYLPSKNTPYIIQWHDSYFSNRYVSFFGTASQEIPDAFSAGDAPSSDNVVNVYGNNSMQSGSVAGAYLLENDYGSNGAWLRLEDASEARTILPFECYIRANTPTTTKYRVLRRDMTIDDTPTGLDQIINRKSYNRKFIKDGQLFIIRDDKMYNVYGMEVQK